MQHQVVIEDTGEQYACDERESILDGMARLGRRGIPAGCRGGGCGVCKVQVVSGTFDARVMSRAHISAEELAAGVVLACRVMPHSDLCVQVLGKMKNAICKGHGDSAENHDSSRNKVSVFERERINRKHHNDS